MINAETKVNNVHEIFVNVQKYYNAELRISILDEIYSGRLTKKGSPMNYNYLIMDGTKLFEILNNYKHHDLISKEISNEDFEAFKKTCIYAGKGTNDRKMSHLIFGKQILLKQLNLNKVTAKFSKITQIWERNDALVILHLFTETNIWETDFAKTVKFK